MTWTVLVLKMVFISVLEFLRRKSQHPRNKKVSIFYNFFAYVLKFTNYPNKLLSYFCRTLKITPWILYESSLRSWRHSILDKNLHSFLYQIQNLFKAPYLHCSLKSDSGGNAFLPVTLLPSEHTLIYYFQ